MFDWTTVIVVTPIAVHSLKVASDNGLPSETPGSDGASVSAVAGVGMVVSIKAKTNDKLKK